MGCPILSAGPDAYLAELLLIYAYPAALKFIREVATTEDFRNPRYEVNEAPPEPDDARYWRGYADKDDNKVDGEESRSPEPAPSALAPDVAAGKLDLANKSDDGNPAAAKDDAVPVAEEKEPDDTANRDREPNSDEPAETDPVPASKDHGTTPTMSDHKPPMAVIKASSDSRPSSDDRPLQERTNNPAKNTSETAEGADAAPQEK